MNNSKKIEFCSSVGNSVVAKGTTTALSQLGYDVEEIYSITGRPSGGMFQQILRRFWMYPGFGVKLFFHNLLSHGDYQIVTTNPFFAPSIACFSKKKRKIIHLVWDLFPEALIYYGSVSKDSFLARSIRSTVKYALKSADANVFLGEHLYKYVEAHFGKVNNPHIIHVGTDTAQFQKQPSRDIHDLSFLYCGNLGKLHDIDVMTRFMLYEGWNRFKGNIIFNFHASGTKYPQLKEKLKNLKFASNVKINFGSSLPSVEWIKVMESCQIALVTMILGGENVVMPSKTYSAMAAGQAILAICAEESDLSDLVNKHNCGWVIPVDDPNGLEKCCDNIITDQEGVYIKRMNSQAAVRKYYDFNILAQQWNQVLKSL